MAEENLTPYQIRLREIKAKRAKERAEAEAQQKPAVQVVVDEDLIPDQQYERSEEDQQMDAVIDGIDILGAYRQWCGKEVDEKTTNRTEGIMVSCPIPGHRDAHPSAWINRDKQTWFCGACQEGGDKYDIAAYHFGYPVPKYKEGANFHELRREMAESMGFTFTKLPGGAVEVSGPADEPPLIVAAPEPEPGKVVELFPTEDDDDEDEDALLFPKLDWQTIAPVGTFLDEYMKATTQDDLPEEYHFWNALLAIGFALGRDVTLYDKRPVYGNLFVCTLGHSGSGKSMARAHLDTLLKQALPHDWNDANSKGVRKVSSPGSAEVLIHNFQKPVMDPTNPKVVAWYAPVRGMIDFNELSSLVGRASRLGNVLVPTLMQFYDVEDDVSTSSMTHGLKQASHPFASALTTTQPRALRGLLTKADVSSGFLNRWLFAPGTPKKRVAIGGVRVDMTPAVAPLKRILAWASGFKADEMIDWSPEAYTRFTEFYHTQIAPDQAKAPNDILTRVDLLMKKLVLLFTANRMEKVAPVESVEDAIACYEYIIAAYGISSESIGISRDKEIEQAVEAVLQRKTAQDKGGLTPRDISRSLARKGYTSKELERVLDAMAKMGYVEIVKTKQGSIGRPATRYKYVG